MPTEILRSQVKVTCCNLDLSPCILQKVRDIHIRTLVGHLWIADYCITGTFSTRVILVSYAYFNFLKNTYVFYLSYAYPRTLQKPNVCLQFLMPLRCIRLTNLTLCPFSLSLLSEDLTKFKDQYILTVLKKVKIELGALAAE